MTSKQAFSFFQDELKFWQKELGLLDWQIDSAFDSQEEGNRATANIHSEAHSSFIILEKGWVEGETAEVVDETIVRRSAFHEVCEVMLDDLESITDALSDADRARARVAAHAIIRRLENCLFPLRWAIEKKEKR